MDIVSSTKVGRSLPKTIMLVVRSFRLWEAYTQTCLEWEFFTTACWCRSMIACQVSWISDEFWIYYNLKIRNLNVCCQVTLAGCLTFIPISCMRPKHVPKDKIFDFSTNLYAPEHVHVVQIGIMHINALKTHLMHKNVQTNPEKSEKITQHSCCSMLTREIFWKQ